MRHHHSIKNINIGIFSFVMSFDAVVGFYQAFKGLIKSLHKISKKTGDFLTMDKLNKLS